MTNGVDTATEQQLGQLVAQILANASDGVSCAALGASDADGCGASAGQVLLTAVPGVTATIVPLASLPSAEPISLVVPSSAGAETIDASVDSAHDGGGSLVIAVYEPTGTLGGRGLNGSQAAMLASVVVSIDVIGSSAPPNASSIATATVSFPVPALSMGNGSCVAASLFSFGSGECVGGCCSDAGRCVCREGYSGPLCEFEYVCGVSDVAGGVFDIDACIVTTPTVSDNRVTCTCRRQSGFFGVLAAKFASSHAISLPGNLFMKLAAELGKSRALWQVLLIIMCYCLLASAASLADAKALYTRAVPWWFQTEPEYSLGKYVTMLLLTRTSILRLWFVTPEHGHHTRVQVRRRGTASGPPAPRAAHVVSNLICACADLVTACTTHAHRTCTCCSARSSSISSSSAPSWRRSSARRPPASSHSSARSSHPSSPSSSDASSDGQWWAARCVRTVCTAPSGTLVAVATPEAVLVASLTLPAVTAAAAAMSTAVLRMTRNWCTARSRSRPFLRSRMLSSSGGGQRFRRWS